MTDVTGIILHFRDASRTLACLRSIVFEGVTQVIVVDNSEDGGASIDRIRDTALTISNVHILSPALNLGFGRGMNLALDYLTKNFHRSAALLINSDATLKEGSLRRLVAVVNATRKCIVAPAIDGPTGLVSATVYYRHILGMITVSKGVGPQHRVLGGACLLIHPDVVRAKLFDEDFFFYGDDIELSYRMSRNGVRLVDEPSATVVHEGSKGSVMGSIFYEYHMARAHLLMPRKLNFAPVAVVGLVTFRIFTLAARAILRSARARSIVPFSGLCLAIKDVLSGRVRSLTPPPGFAK